MTLEEAKKRITPEINGDDEVAHGNLDDLLEERLAIYEPDFVKGLLAWYNDKYSRWCA